MVELNEIISLKLEPSFITTPATPPSLINTFDNADIVFITDIYSAGEDKIKGISKEKLASSISLNGVKDVRLLKNYETLHSNLKEICNRGDFIIFLGAGNISKVAKKITEQFRAELTKSI